MTELEEKGLKFYLRHVGVVASDEDFEAWYMQRHLGGRVWGKLCHFWVAGRPTPTAVEKGLDVEESVLHASGTVPVLVGESSCVYITRPLPASAGTLPYQ